MNALELIEVTKRYPAPRRLSQALAHPFRRRIKEALRGVDLTVAPGELVTIMGPTGAGKTTLLKLVATLLLPSRGTVRVWGHTVGQDDAAIKRRVGIVVSDERSFYWRLTGQENLEFFAALQGFAGAEARARIESVLEIAGLSEVAQERFTGYSAGMRQKLAIARGLLHDPELLILDEPTRSLDPFDQVRIAAFVQKRLVGELGRTVVLATHDLALVERLAERVVLLQAGRIRGDGTRTELAARLGVARSIRLGPADRLSSAGLPGVTGLEPLAGSEARLALAPEADPPEILSTLVARGHRLSTFLCEEASWARIAEAAGGPA